MTVHQHMREGNLLKPTQKRKLFSLENKLSLLKKVKKKKWIRKTATDVNTAYNPAKQKGTLSERLVLTAVRLRLCKTLTQCLIACVTCY